MTASEWETMFVAGMSIQSGACDVMTTNQQRIHREAIVVVAHDHRPIGPDLTLMRAGGVDAKVYQVALDVDPEQGREGSRHLAEGWLNRATQGMETVLRDIEAHAEQCILAKNVEDIERAKEAGRIAILLGIEGARWLEGSLEPLHSFYGLGLRELQLKWSFQNQLVPQQHLSDFGREVVSECERLGILVDLTHLPPEAFYDVIEVARNPVIVSHGSAKALTADLDDDRIRALASTGGVLGIHFYTTYLGASPGPEDMVKQVAYVSELVGIDHVALGVDFFPTEGAWRKLQEECGTTELEWAVEDMRGMPEITHHLIDHGFSEAEVRKVLGLNFLRVCRKVFDT